MFFQLFGGTQKIHEPLTWFMSYTAILSNQLKAWLIMNEIQERIEKSVKLLSYKIKNFDEAKLQTEEGNIEYNKMIVKKAVLVDKLKSKKRTSLYSFWQKIIRKTKGKTLICDRF